MSLIVFVAMRMVRVDSRPPCSAHQGAATGTGRTAQRTPGLNDPLIVHSRRPGWKNALHGDTSANRSARTRIFPYELARRAGVTIELALLSTLISIGLGVPLGIIAAVKRGAHARIGVRGLSLLFLSIPISFWARC
ncbi:MAG: hypothetical protein R2855_03095 [Thermomicrobiales bacterium]